LVLLVPSLLLASSRRGIAEDLLLVTDGYQIFQTVFLSKEVHGLTGLLQILEDERITPGLRRDMWRGFNDPTTSLANLGVGPNDPAYMSFTRQRVRPAKIRLLDDTNETLDARTFDAPLATIETESLTFTWPQTTFLVTVDHSIGMGSYAGADTFFATVADRKLRWGIVIDGSDNRELAVGRALKRDWRLEWMGTGLVSDILSVSSRPNFENSRWQDTGEFVTLFQRFHFDGGAWHRTERREIGSWESEQPFPEAAKFPPP
jgi:hypothetical protein